MSEDKILRSVDIEIGGDVRKLKFTIGSLMELEANLPLHNVLELMQRTAWSVTELVIVTWIGLKYYDKKLTRLTVQNWVNEYNQTHDGGDLFNKVFAALGLSGILGKDVSVFENILKENAEDAEEEDPLTVEE